MSVQPVGFLVVGHNQVRLLPIDSNAAIDRIIDLAPQVLNQLQSIIMQRQGTATVRVTESH